MGSLHLSGRTGRAGGQGDPRQIEGDQRRLGLEPGDRKGEGIRQPLGIGTRTTTASGAIRRSSRSASSRKARSRTASVPISRRAISAATPNPAIAATFSVPAREPFSCPPPRISLSAISTASRGGSAPDAFRPADLVRRERQRHRRRGSAISTGILSGRLNRIAYGRARHAHERAPRSRRSAEERRSRCWRAWTRDQNPLVAAVSRWRLEPGQIEMPSPSTGMVSTALGRKAVPVENAGMLGRSDQKARRPRLRRACRKRRRQD